MAKKKSYKYKTKTIYKKSRNSGGSFKPVIDGFIAGIAGQLASNYIGIYGHPAVTIGIGMWRKNNVLKTEGARELGAAIASQIPIIGGTSPYSGVY